VNGKPKYHHPSRSERIDPARAVALYSEGNSLPAVARMLGSSITPVRSALKRAGVPIRSISDGKSLAARGNRYLSNGYVMVITGKYQREREHMLIAARALGRSLKRHECVHHVNCDKADNRPSNLIICTLAYHTALHHRMAKHPHWSQFPKAKE
jgi:hypothetical protein